MAGPICRRVRTEAENGSHTAKVTEDDLDYMPMEAGSGLVEIPGLTAGTVTPLEQEAVLVQEDALTSEAAQGQQKGEEETAGADTAEENEGEKTRPRQAQEEKALWQKRTEIWRKPYPSGKRFGTFALQHGRQYLFCNP